MDRKSIIVLVFCFVLFLLWSSVILPKLYPPKPGVPGATAALTNTPYGVTNQEAAAPQISTAPAPAPEWLANTNVPEQLVVVSNRDARYTFSSYGGGIKKIELLDYPETVPSWRQKVLATNQVATLDARAQVPTLAVLDGPELQGDGAFQIVRTPQGVRATQTLTNGLTLTKDFAIESNYLVRASVQLENHSAKPLSLPAQRWVVGTATAMNPQDNPGLMWFNGEKAADISGLSYFSSRRFGCVPRVPPEEYVGGESNVVWAAVHNQYFALAVIPQDKAEQVIARKVALPPLSQEDTQFAGTNLPPPVGYEASLVYPAATLPAGGSIQRSFVLYGGPKEYRTLARIANAMDNHLDSLMGFSTFWGFFSKALLLAMNGLHATLGLSYGWTIVAITVLIKLIFWPLTAASTRSMKRMQALQPQLAALKEKYKDDPMKVQRKTMELFKENKVNPMGGCLPMIIQTPVFIGFFTMIRSAIELRGAQFLWIKDLSKPDTLFIIPGLGFVPFIGIPGLGLPFNLLPLIMGGTMLWQSHLTPASPGMDPAQQKLMRYMPLMFLVILYNYSAGMAVYWTMNNLLTILQTKVTRARQSTTPAPALTAPSKRTK